MISNKIKSPQFSNGETDVKAHIDKLQKYIIHLERKLIESDRKLKKEKAKSQDLENKIRHLQRNRS
jgi:peptidoglycan hydrolase CwlO-like protein